MIYFRTGSQAHRLVMLLSVAGEYPTNSIKILGNERVYKALIHKLITMPNTIYNPQTETKIMTPRLFTITGKGAFKSLRLYKGALPILDWIGAKDYYLQSFCGHNFPGNPANIERNHRVAEVLGMCLQAGFEFRPYRLPALQNSGIKKIIPDRPVFYLSKQLKLIGETEMNKTMFTRIIGALYAAGNCYAVYNTRNAVMKWCGMGESKTLNNLVDIGRANAGIDEINSAILIGKSDSVAMGTIEEILKSRRLDLRFNATYPRIHFVPMHESGVRQLRLFTVPDWKEKMLDLLFESDARSYGRGSFDYDACVNDVFVFSFLDGDIARLIRFQKGVKDIQDKCEVLCFPDQVKLVRKFIGALAEIKVIDRTLMETELGIKKEELA